MSSARCLGLAFASSCALLGCADEPPELTEMVVVIEAGSQVRAMADRVDVAVVTGADPTTVAALPASSSRVFTLPKWPLSLTLLASQPSATLSVVVTAYKGVEPLVTRSVLTQFLPERSLMLGVTLHDACIGDLLSCTAYGSTCDAATGVAACITPAVDARSLPDYEGQRFDAGLPVAEDAGADASDDGGADAGDAGGCNAMASCTAADSGL